MAPEGNLTTGSAFERLLKRVLGFNAFLVLAFVYAPIVALVVYSFSGSRVAIVLEGFSVEAYGRLLSRPQFYEALANSLSIAFFSTLLSTLLGAGIAWYLERGRSRTQKMVSGAVYLPLFLPELVLSIALLFFMARVVRPVLGLGGIEFGSFAAVLAGHVAFSIPYVVLLTRVRLRAFEPVLEDAARDLGATSWQTFWHVVLPWLEPALIGAALLVFALSLDDFYVTYFVSVGGSGFQTLPVYLFALQSRQGVTTELNALAALILAISLGTIALSAFIQYKELSRLFEEKPS